jgi:hypothetical protein
MSDDFDGTMFLTPKEARQIEEALGDDEDDDYDEDYDYRVAEGNNGL